MISSANRRAKTRDHYCTDLHTKLLVLAALFPLHPELRYNTCLCYWEKYPCAENPKVVTMHCFTPIKTVHVGSISFIVIISIITKHHRKVRETAVAWQHRDNDC